MPSQTSEPGQSQPSQSQPSQPAQQAQPAVDPATIAAMFAEANDRPQHMATEYKADDRPTLNKAVFHDPRHETR